MKTILEDKIDKLDKHLHETNHETNLKLTEQLGLQRKQVMNLKSDFKLEVENCREELGLSNQNLSPKINLYSLSRVVEMLL